MSPPAPAARASWHLASLPAPGSFVGDGEEDFIGVLTRSDGTLELFAADGADGRVAWSKVIDGSAQPDRAVPFALAGKLVAWAREGESRVHVLDATTGHEERVFSLREGTTVSRMCISHGTTIMIPQPSGYDALLDLRDGAQPNNSGLYPRPACMRRGPERKVPKTVLERLPRELEIGPEPAYSYEPGRVLARSRKGNGDPILLGLGPAGNTRWQTPLALEGSSPLAVVDVREGGGNFAVLTNGKGAESLLFGVDVDSGALRWTYRSPCHARWLVATAQRIYLGSEQGRLHVLRTDGTVLGVYGDGGGECAREASPSSSSGPAAPPSTL